MIKKLLLTVVLIATFLNVFTQNIITWEVLKNVEFDEIWSEEFQAYYMVPKFSAQVLALDLSLIHI